MNFNEQWTANEQQLLREADSLGLLFARIKGKFGDLPVSHQSWLDLLDTAHRFPSTLAGFPLWIAVPVTKFDRKLQLDMSVLGSTQTADCFLKKVQSGDADALTACISKALTALQDEISPLKPIVGDRVLIHCDVESQSSRPAGGDGIFFYPPHHSLGSARSKEHLSDFRIVLDAATSTAAWQFNQSGQNLAERIFLNLAPNTRIGAAGVFPRQAELMQIAVLGFKDASDAIRFLQQINWPGRRASLASLLDRLSAHNALKDMQLGLRISIRADCLEPILELNVFSADTIYDSAGWFKDKECWTPFMAALQRETSVDCDKLSGLAAACGTNMIFGRAGPLALLKRIHHFAFELAGDEVVQVSAHLFVLMTRCEISGKKH